MELRTNTKNRCTTYHKEQMCNATKRLKEREETLGETDRDPRDWGGGGGDCKASLS